MLKRFRAKIDKCFECERCWVHFSIKNIAYNIVNGYTPIVDELDMDTLCQFTGLYDDNGVEIYEGDIVEVRDLEETKTSHTSVVYFDYSGAYIDAHPFHRKINALDHRILKHYCDYGIGDYRPVKCKVIGNIYDNPELIPNYHVEEIHTFCSDANASL